MTASASNCSPKTVCAKPSMAVGSAFEPRVAEVATGVMRPRAGAIVVGDVRAVGPVRFDGEAEATQQHRDVGALCAVVSVEFVEDDVLQRVRGQTPDVGAVGVQQQVVEHLVVGEQDVRGAACISERSVMRPSSVTLVRPPVDCSPV